MNKYMAMIWNSSLLTIRQIFITKTHSETNEVFRKHLIK